MDLQSVCRDVMDDVDGSLGCVLTDLETGLPLAAEYRAGTVMNGNMITLVSHVGIDLFRGKLVRNFERSLSRNRGSPDGFVREVQLTTRDTYQFMSAVPGWDHVIFILITNKNVSLGMGLLAVHDAVNRLEEIPKRTAAPAVNTTLPPREEPSAGEFPPTAEAQGSGRSPVAGGVLPSKPSEPSATSPAQAPEPRGPERDIAFDAPPRREVVRDGTPEIPQRVDTGIEPQPRSAASFARASGTPEDSVPERTSPEASPSEPTAPPAEPPTSAVGETPELGTQTGEAPHPETEHQLRGIPLDDSKTEESTPSPVPIGPRARMFFKRPRDERENSRRRRS